jgi:hypothetical protein
VHFRHEKEFTDNVDLKIYIITDLKGLIRDVSALGFAYFNLTKDNLSSTERYIDEFGINFSTDLYKDGTLLHITKKPIIKNQETIEDKKTNSLA